MLPFDLHTWSPNWNCRTCVIIPVRLGRLSGIKN
nr:MAG TPA: hypothetical protein [Caudoviricetes sp.]